METVILVIHLVVAVALIAVVMLQRSEGGALGIGGGGGSAGNLFTARGVGNALTRTTAWLAVAFFCTSIGLTLIATHRGSGSVINSVTPPASTSGSQPAAPAQGSGDSAVLPKLAPTAPAQPQVPVNP